MQGPVVGENGTRHIPTTGATHVIDLGTLGALSCLPLTWDYGASGGHIRPSPLRGHGLESHDWKEALSLVALGY